MRSLTTGGGEADGQTHGISQSQDVRAVGSPHCWGAGSGGGAQALCSMGSLFHSEVVPSPPLLHCPLPWGFRLALLCLDWPWGLPSHSHSSFHFLPKCPSPVCLPGLGESLPSPSWPGELRQFTPPVCASVWKWGRWGCLVLRGPRRDACDAPGASRGEGCVSTAVTITDAVVLCLSSSPSPEHTPVTAHLCVGLCSCRLTLPSLSVQALQAETVCPSQQHTS